MEKPLQDKVIIKCRVRSKETESSGIIVDTGEVKDIFSEVVAVSKVIQDKDLVRVGDLVRCTDGAGSEIVIEGEKLNIGESFRLVSSSSLLTVK